LQQQAASEQAVQPSRGASFEMTETFIPQGTMVLQPVEVGLQASEWIGWCI
jgi:hypothetical protein